MSVPYPENVIIDIGTICGYKCIFCAAARRPPQYLPFLSIKKIIDEIPKIKLLNIGGSGEFFFHPDIDKILSLISTRKIPFLFSTNGEYVTDERQKMLRNSLLKSINFSINSLNPEIKKFLSGDKGDSNIVINNFKKFVKKPREYDVTISMVVNNYNYKEMPDFVQLGVDYGVNKISLTQLSERVSYPDGLVLSNDGREIPYYEKAKEIAQKHNVLLGGMDRNKNNEQKKRPIKDCPLPWTHVGIMPNNNVVPCCYLPFIAGNLDTESFYDIWNSKKMNELRNSICENDNKFCKSCVLFE